MRKLRATIVDYQMGNHSSVAATLKDIDLKVNISSKIEELNKADILILPGVGAFPKAVKNLHKLGLFKYLQHQAKAERPILGICLGMQLLTGVSYEFGYTEGLEIIPGEIIPLANKHFHIGWNSIEVQSSKKDFNEINNKNFYFNHSFYYKGPKKYCVASAYSKEQITSIIMKGSSVGVQFHPEKSQDSGKQFLKMIVNKYC